MNNPLEISFRENRALIHNNNNELLLSGTTSPKQKRPSIPHESPPITVSLQGPLRPAKNDRYGSPAQFDLSQLQSAEFGGTLLATNPPAKDLNQTDDQLNFALDKRRQNARSADTRVSDKDMVVVKNLPLSPSRPDLESTMGATINIGDPDTESSAKQSFGKNYNYY